MDFPGRQVAGESVRRPVVFPPRLIDHEKDFQQGNANDGVEVRTDIPDEIVADAAGSLLAAGTAR